MIARTRMMVIVPALALTVTLALTGCGRLGAHAGSGSGSSSGLGGATASTPAADDSGTLDGISQDLDSAGSANTEAESNTQAGDQAAATGDEP